MRRLLIYSDSSSNFSGVEQTNHEIGMGLQKAGYSVSFVQPFADHHLVDVRKNFGVVHHWIEGAKSAQDNKDLFFELKPDLILFSDCGPLSNIEAKQVAIELRIPFLIIVQDVNLEDVERSAQELTHLAPIFDAAQSVIGSSQSILDLLYGRLGLPLDRGIVVYPGRPSSFFAETDELVRTALRETLGVPEKGILCLTIANMTNEMEVGCFANAIKQIGEANKLQNLHFVWIGDGPEKENMIQLISDVNGQDRFHQIEPRTDIVPFLNAADVFVQLNRYHATPLVLVEAMAKGLPVISTGVDGVSELLDEAGFLLPDPVWGPVATILAKTVSWMDRSQQLREEMGAAGAKRAKQFFRSDQMVHTYLNLLEAVFYRLESALNQETKKAMVEELNPSP